MYRDDFGYWEEQFSAGRWRTAALYVSASVVGALLAGLLVTGYVLLERYA